MWWAARRFVFPRLKLMETSSAAPLRRIIVRESERMLVISIDEVDWVESADNYVLLHVGKATHVVRETLAALEARCPAGHFIRISRNALVNAARVRQIVAEPAGYSMLLAGGHRLPITRGIREVLARIEGA